LEFLGGSVQYHNLKTIPAEYVLKRWTRDVRHSIDKPKPTINVGTEGTTQAQRYQQICAVTIQLCTRVCTDPEASQVFLNGVIEAGKKAEELLMSKGFQYFLLNYVFYLGCLCVITETISVAEWFHCLC
jgi:hypothetical protein